MYTTTAKFNSTCAATGKRINRGERMYYNKTTRQCFSMESQNTQTDTAKMVQANEEAYFDNFCLANNI
jgi:hypothetical protein